MQQTYAYPEWKLLMSGIRPTVLLPAHKITSQNCLFHEAGCSVWSLTDAAHKLLQYHLAFWYNASRVKNKSKIPTPFLLMANFQY